MVLFRFSNSRSLNFDRFFFNFRNMHILELGVCKLLFAKEEIFKACGPYGLCLNYSTVMGSIKAAVDSTYISE